MLEPAGDSGDTCAMALSDGAKERIKLEAAYVNGIALNALTAGVLAPVAGWAFLGTFSQAQAFPAALFSVVCFAGSIGLHYRAQRKSDELDR